MGRYLPEFILKICFKYLIFSLATPFYIFRFSGRIVKGKFSAELKLSGRFFLERGIFKGEFPILEISLGRKFHGEIITLRNSSWENFARKEFTILWEGFPGNFFHVWGISVMNLKRSENK